MTIRRSRGFHQRDLKRASVGRRQSYGTPRNVPVSFRAIGSRVALRGRGIPGSSSRFRVVVRRLPPALAASATPQILELLGEPPKEGRGRVLELGFAGIHARPLELAGWDVVVVDSDPRARERFESVADEPTGRFDAVVAPADADLTGIDAARIVLVDERGVASMSA